MNIYPVKNDPLTPGNLFWGIALRCCIVCGGKRARGSPKKMKLLVCFTTTSEISNSCTAQDSILCKDDSHCVILEVKPAKLDSNLRPAEIENLIYAFINKFCKFEMYWLGFILDTVL